MSCNDYASVVKLVKGDEGVLSSDSRTSFATHAETMSNARQLAVLSRELAGHAVEYARLVDEWLDGVEAKGSADEMELVVEQAIGLAGAMRLTWDDLVMTAMRMQPENAHA